MKSLAFLITTLVLVGCAHSSTAVDSEEKENGVTQLNDNDLMTLDRSQYLIQVHREGKFELERKSLALAITAEDFGTKNLSLHDINFKFWAGKYLKNKFDVEKLRDSTVYIGLLTYEIAPVENSRIFVRTIHFKVFDYQAFKKDNKVKLLSQETIKSYGPNAKVSDLLPIMSAYVGSSFGGDADRKYLITPQDPLLAPSKEVPVSIDVNDFNLNTQEIQFINSQKGIGHD